MNVMETINMAEQLNRAGYSVLSSTATTVTVASPVQCSCGGGKRWVEYEPVTLRTSAAVHRFINEGE